MWERVKKVLPILILAGAGFGVSVAIEAVHRQLAADVNYTSFCNLSATVNCDAILSSPYAVLVGIPVSTWSILYHIGVFGLAIAVAGARRATVRETLTTLLLVATTCGLLFSIYMAAVAFVVLHRVCLMCSALYLVAVGLFAAAWRLRATARRTRRLRGTDEVRQDRVVLIGSIAAAVALIAIGSWEALGGGVHRNDPEEIKRERPEFYQWYMAQPVIEVPADASPSRGSADAQVTIVEFSDFECGHCADFHQSLDDLLHSRGQNVRVVFRHFPLDSTCNPAVPTRMHPQACLAAMAAECAGEQGKFWQYHNLLFENQKQLDRQFLIAYAERLGLDVARFTTCLSSDAARARVERDAKQGTQLGVESTPTVFINGRTIKGALNAQWLADAVTLAAARF